MTITRRIAILAIATIPAMALAQAPAPEKSQPQSCTATGNAPMKGKLTTSMGPIVI